MPKTVDTRKHCKVYRVESMQQASTTPKNKDVGRGLRKIGKRHPSLKLHAHALYTCNGSCDVHVSMRAAIGSCDDEYGAGNRSGGLGSCLVKAYTRLVRYTKDHARSKMRPLYVKSMVCRPFSLAVGRLKKRRRKRRWRKSRFGRFPYITLMMFSSYFVSVSRYRSS